MSWKILIRSADGGRAEEHAVPDGKRVVLGRSPEAAVRLDHGELSREHLSIHVEGGEAFVTDLSANGSFVNGTRLQKGAARKVTADDVFAVPGFELRVANDAAAQAAGDESAGKLAFLRPVTSFLGSSTFGERFFAAVSLAALSLAVLYWRS